MSGRVAPASIVQVVAPAGLAAAVVTFDSAWWMAAAIGGVVGAALLLGGRAHRRARPPAHARVPRIEPNLDDAAASGPVVLQPSDDGMARLATSADARSLGWHVNAFSTLRLDEFVHGQDIERTLAAIETVRDVPLGIACVAVRVRTPEAWRWMEITVTNATSIAHVGGIVLAQRDVTEHHAVAVERDAREDQIAAVGAAITLATDHADLRSMAQQLAVGVRQAIDVSSCELYLATDGGMELLVGAGPGGLMARRTVAPGTDDVVTTCARTGGAVALLDDGRIVPAGRATSTTEAVVFATPVTIEGDDRGVLLVRSITPRDVDETDKVFLATVAGIVTLVARHHSVEQDALHRSRHDVLTGLVNRTVLFEHLERALTRASRRESGVAVVLLDLDGFKLINDSLGHAAGDAAIEAISLRLAAALRPGDVLARFGGDEFVVLAPSVASMEHAVVQAERIRRAVGAPISVAGERLVITASAGVAVAGPGHVSAEELLQQADAAMHDAKAKGRERTEFFTDELRSEATTRLRTAAELRDALTNGQLRVFYQPVVDLATGATVAAEALVRWVHPGRGLVAPSEFIPISEESGLIEEIGAWVIRASVAQAAAWSAEGHPLQVSVNISPRQFADPRLPAIIDQALRDHDLDPALLAVELSEATIMAERSVSFETLRVLADLGVGITIDDFGTGYSSLTYLRSLPVDTVKIDRSFVANIVRSGDDYAITAAMIGLGQTLDKRVVAEGIETEEQLAVIKDLGCDLGQGFLFSPAVISLDFNRSDSRREPAASGASGGSPAGAGLAESDHNGRRQA